jgi:hypothetical protein
MLQFRMQKKGHVVSINTDEAIDTIKRRVALIYPGEPDSSSSCQVIHLVWCAEFTMHRCWQTSQHHSFHSRAGGE